MKFLTVLLFLVPAMFASSQNRIGKQLLSGEKWWAGTAHYGHLMPFGIADTFSFDLYGDKSNNQSSPLLLSSKGRWIWCDDPFFYSFTGDSILVKAYPGSKIQSGISGNTLQSAYQLVSKKFFPPSGKWPDSLLLTSPQYNLWIELQYNPNQKDVLNYAKKVMEYGLPPGVLMIDDNWSNYYGEFDFDKSKFSDAREMVRWLHEMGFKVMLWICPFITPDSKEFRELMEKKLLLMSNGGNPNLTYETSAEPLIIHWWNGYSACLDLTNPGSKEWLMDKLNFLRDEYGIDGFKLDAGDPYFYDNPQLLCFKEEIPNDHTVQWGEIGMEFSLNEFRAMWKMGGQPLVERLADKSHSWTDLQKLIPNTITQQLMGYTFTCPDMIGGGQFTSFLPGKPINQKLIVRSAQVHALMPMMQFSVAPWRILDQQHLDAVLTTVALRQEMMPRIMAVMRESVQTGEPALRPLAYNYPEGGYENVKDQFMMGRDILVAPVVTESNEREILLPSGMWRYQNRTWEGNKKYTLLVKLDEIPVFVRIDQND